MLTVYLLPVDTGIVPHGDPRLDATRTQSVRQAAVIVVKVRNPQVASVTTGCSVLTPTPACTAAVRVAGVVMPQTAPLFAPVHLLWHSWEDGEDSWGLHGQAAQCRTPQNSH